MAVVSVAKSNQMALVLQDGTDEKGKPKLKRKTYGNVKKDAVQQDIYDIAAALSGLQSLPFAGVEQTVQTEIGLA